MVKMKETVFCFVIAVVAVLIIFFLVWNLIGFMDGMGFTCALCSKNVWQIPKEYNILGQDVKICRDCVKSLEEVGSLFN